MKWKIEAGIRADQWFRITGELWIFPTLFWVYNRIIKENIPTSQPMVIRVEFGIEVAEPLTKEDARMTLQSFLDTATGLYNLYVLYACYDPSKKKLTLEIQLDANAVPYDVIMSAANLISQCFGAGVYWDKSCDAAWLTYVQGTMFLVSYEVPIAYITEEPKFPIFVLVGLGATIAAVAIGTAVKKRKK